MSRKFDRFMVDVNIASNPKLATLSPAERWCAVAGVFALAALSPVRGRLLIGNHRADVTYVAHHARVTTAVARSTMRKMREVGMLSEDEEYDCEAVHDFDQWNPAPKADTTAADRQRRYRERSKAASRRNGNDVTPPVTPPEVEVEVEGEENTPLTPLDEGGTVTQGEEIKAPPNPGSRQRKMIAWQKTAVEWSRSQGAEGSDEMLLRAVNQSKPWEHDDQLAAFREFFIRHFGPMEVAA